MIDSDNKSPWKKMAGMTWLMGCLFAAMLCLGQISPTFWQNSTTAEVTQEQEQSLAMKSVADFEVGDSILAYNHVTRKPELSRVAQVFERTSDHLRLITFADATGEEQLIKTTDEHPFWSVRLRKYVNANELRVGDDVLDPDGNRQTVQSTTREEHPDGIQVYNVEVDRLHNYYVKASNSDSNPILVHNADYDGAGPPVKIDGRGRWHDASGRYTYSPTKTPTDRLKAQLFERPGKLKSESAVRGAVTELKGGAVKVPPRGGRSTWDHITKVRNAQRGLANRIKQIKSELSDPSLSATSRRRLEAELSEASRLLDLTRQFVPK